MVSYWNFDKHKKIEPARYFVKHNSLAQNLINFFFSYFILFFSIDNRVIGNILSNKWHRSYLCIVTYFYLTTQNYAWCSNLYIISNYYLERVAFPSYSDILAANKVIPDFCITVNDNAAEVAYKRIKSNIYI